MPAKNYYETTVQDFSGGLSLVDNELNLDPRYAVELNNIGRDSDGSLRPRYGFKLIFDGHDGTETIASRAITLNFTLNSTYVRGAFTGSNPLANGDHIQFNSSSGITAVASYQIERKFGAIVPDGIGGGALTFAFHLRSPATATQTVSATMDIVTDNHTLSGNVVQSVYFQDFAILFDDVGEICAVNSAGVGERIWSFSEAMRQMGTATPATQSGWRYTEYVNTDVNKSTLLAANGADPVLAIDNNAAHWCSWHVDPSTGSNAAIPIAALLKSSAGYEVMFTNDAPAVARISAKHTSSVFTGNPSPDDAVDVDVSQVTTAVNPEIRALATLRDKLFMSFEDSCVLAVLGAYSGTTGEIHEPDFADVMTQIGCVSQRTCISLGNDIFMLDYSGVPSISMSATSGAYIPSRISDLIEPMLQRHIARLTESTLVRQAFAVWNFRSKQYMLFLPKYDATDVRALDTNPIFILEEFIGKNELGLICVAHNLEVGDTVIISGVTGSYANLSASDINGTRSVVRILGDDAVVISTAVAVNDSVSSTGGDGITLQPTTDESIGYIYNFNPALRIKAWSIYRGLKFRSGFRSLLGDCFFTIGAKMYKFGSAADPIYTDYHGDYNIRTWTSGTEYQAGVVVNNNGKQYECLVTHTSAGVSFSAAIAANPSYWTQFYGKSINWSWELPWADFAKRWREKVLRYFMPNATGNGRMTVQFFVDQIKYHPVTRELAPAKEMSFTGADTGGFGNQSSQSYGGGRRTREELLWHLPLRSKLLKLRLTGAAAEPLRIVGLSFIYQLGGYRR